MQESRRPTQTGWNLYEQSGGDYLADLQQKYKINQIRATVLEVFLEDLWQTTAQITAAARQRLGLGRKGSSEHTVWNELGGGLYQFAVHKVICQRTC